MEVQFRQAGERRFDLVIGADGLHSNVRRLVFGPQHLSLKMRPARPFSRGSSLTALLAY